MNSALSALLLASLVLFCLLLPSPVSAHTLVGGNGRISGQLLDGSNHNAPLPKQTVTLQMAQGPNASDLTTATTDDHGTFTFSNLATDKTISYAIYIRYQGAQYTSDLVSLADTPTQHLDLTVYQATSSTAKVAITQASILIQEPGAHNGTFSVTEDFAFKNLDTRTYVGSLDASKGKPNALLFSLPHGAKNVSLTTGFNGYHVISVDTGFASDAALPPGDSEFAFSFDVPYSASTYDFSYIPMYPTVVLSFLIPPDINAHSNTLTAQGVITGQDQHSYRLFKSNLLKANQQIDVALEGLVLPSATTSAPVSLNAGVIWLIGALLLMLAIICVTWFLLRSPRRTTRRNRSAAAISNGSRSTPASPAKKPTHKAAALKKGRSSDETSQSRVASSKSRTPDEKTPQSRPVASSKSRASDETPVSRRAAPLEGARAAQTDRTDRKDALLKELLDLDKSYEAGKLNKATYQERRAKTKARLRSLISEQEATRK